MASANLQDCFRVPGRLAIGPSQAGLLQAFPHGGTEVGRISEAFVAETEEITPILSEARGKIVGAVRGSVTYVVGFTLLQWDPDGYGLVFRTTTTSAGGYQGVKTIEGSTPGNVSATSKLIFSPDDPRHPAVLIYAPIPYLGNATRRLEFSLKKDLEVALIFLAAEDSNGNDIAIDRLEHLSLT